MEKPRLWGQGSRLIVVLVCLRLLISFDRHPGHPAEHEARDHGQPIGGYVEKHIGKRPYFPEPSPDAPLSPLAEPSEPPAEPPKCPVSPNTQ